MDQDHSVVDDAEEDAPAEEAVEEDGDDHQVGGD
jgi:hypothetical protein